MTIPQHKVVCSNRPHLPVYSLRIHAWYHHHLFIGLIDCSDFRHTCEQHEGMAGYGWDEYDIRKGGHETIHDAGNTLDVTIDFIKVPGGSHGGNWGARIKGVPRADAPPDQPTTVIFYTGMEGLGNLEIVNEADPLGYKGDVKVNGEAPGLGSFTIDVTRGPESNTYPPRDHPSYDDKPLDRTLAASFRGPHDALWQVKRTYLPSL